MDARAERRLVTCLFIDVVGSTDATVRLGPERMQRLLGDAFAEMSATISDHGGTIEKYVGDAIFALFGAPVAHADDAERALRAADACARWSVAPTTSTARLGVRVGIETGEALVDLGYAVAALNAGDLARANKQANRLLEESARRSVHTRQHAYGVNALLQLAEGAWDSLNATTRELTQLIEANPDSGFCLIGASATGYGAIADILAGRGVPEHLDEFVARIVDESILIRASAVMVPKVMAGDDGALVEGLGAYAADLRLWDRARAWDACDLMPAIALTMMERWYDLGPSLARLDEFAAGGGELAGAAAAAIREEEAAARGGPPPTHDQLVALGYAGISELLRFRPPSGTSTAQP